MNRKETKKLTDKYQKYDCDIYSEDKQNQKLQLLISLEGLKVPKPKPIPPNFEEILANMENRINSNTLDMMTKMEDRINSKIDEVKSDINNLKYEMNNRFDKLELRVVTLEGFHQADFAKNQ